MYAKAMVVCMRLFVGVYSYLSQKHILGGGKIGSHVRNPRKTSLKGKTSSSVPCMCLMAFENMRFHTLPCGVCRRSADLASLLTADFPRGAQKRLHFPHVLLLLSVSIDDVLMKRTGSRPSACVVDIQSVVKIPTYRRIYCSALRSSTATHIVVCIIYKCSIKIVLISGTAFYVFVACCMLLSWRYVRTNCIHAPVEMHFFFLGLHLTQKVFWST